MLDICVDGAGNLWASTDDGHVLFYNKVTDRFEKRPELSSSATGDLDNFFDVDADGNLWILSRRRIITRNCITGNIEKYLIKSKENRLVPMPAASTHFYFKNTDLILVPSDEYSIYRLKKNDASNNDEKDWNIDGSYTVQVDREPGKYDYYFHPLSYIYESSEGVKWLFNTNGIFIQEIEGIFREFKGSLMDYDFPAERLFVWGDPNGVCHIYDPSTKSEFRIHDENIHELSAFYVQNRNILWISGLSASHGYSGLIKIVITPELFKNYQEESGIRNTEAVYAIYKDQKGFIYAGIRGRNHMHVIGPDGRWAAKASMSHDKALQAGHLRAIKGTDTGLWLGYFLGELMFYDFNSGRLIRHRPDVVHCHTILPWTDGTVFIAYNDKFIKYNPVNGNSEQFAEPLGERKFFFCLVPDNKGNIWGGLMDSQVVRINAGNGNYDIIRLSDESYNVESICFGDNNDIWTAFLGGGVCNYNLITGEKKYYTTANGLSNNTTYSILKDKSGFIWVSTNSGISRIDPETGLIRIFDSSDGQNIVEFNSDAFFTAEDGEFFLGGVGGFISFYPDSIARLQNVSSKQKTLITDFKISGETKNFGKPYYSTDSLILSKGDNNFQVSFSSTDFTNSEKTIYRYMLEGVEDVWTETNWRNRRINYSNLRPGWYTLHLQATDRNGQWSASKELKIRIQPYFHQTRFFRIAAPLLFLAIIGMIFSAYILHVRQKERMKQDELRLNALRGQMNPHFIFNSLNSINYFISNNDKLSANSYIADFSRLIRSILANLDKNFVPFETELNSLIDYIKIEHLRFGDKFDYEILTEDKSNYATIEVLPGLVQPFIENAIWHGIRSLESRKGFISVKFTLPGNDRVKCIIEDDGIGRTLASEHRILNENHNSKGIAIVAERLRLISKMKGKNFDFEIVDLYPDRIETGTRVIVEIPTRIK